MHALSLLMSTQSQHIMQDLLSFHLLNFKWAVLKMLPHSAVLLDARHS